MVLLLTTRQKLSRFHSTLRIFGYIRDGRHAAAGPRWHRARVKWLKEHWTDNRYVVGAFLALATINAIALQGGFYR